MVHHIPTFGKNKLRDIFFGMLLILLALQMAGAGAVEDPIAALPMADKHPNALIYTLSSDRTTYSFGDEVYLKISFQNVSKETVFFWQFQATDSFHLRILSQSGTAIPFVAEDRPLAQGAHYPRGISPGETVIEFGTHYGETSIPISEWGYHTLPRGTYFLTVYHGYRKNGTATSNTIQITVK